MPKRCERCQQELEAASYEGAAVERCGRCDAYWVAPPSLAHVLEAKDVVFTREQRHAALEQVSDPPETDPVVWCVRCGEPCKKRDVLGLVLIDYCPGHGIWLDGGELERLQVLAETNEQWRKAVVKLVSGRREEELES